MSINVSYPSQKQFFWNVNNASGVERGINGYYNADTTAVSTTSTTRVNLKTYTFTASAKSSNIRVRVYAHVSGAVNGSTVYLNIDGTDVTNAVVKSTTSRLYIDYIGSIISNASHTIKVDGVAESGYTLYVDKVYIIAGFGLTSTAPTQILTVTLNTANTDSYILKSYGNFVYKMGVRYWIMGNRKTTATSNFSSTLANEVQSTVYTPSSLDDTDNNALITIITGDYPGDNGSFTVSGSVGVAGDIVIITGIYSQVILRANLTDKYNNYNYWSFIVREKGVVGWVSHRISITGLAYTNAVNLNTYFMTKNGQKAIYNVVYPSGNSDVINGFISTSDNTAETTVLIYYNDDTEAETFADYISVVVGE